MSDPLIDKTDEHLLQDAEAALKDIFAAISDGSWSIEHDEDCPEDDTCECVGGKVARKASDVLNAVEYRLHFARGKRVAERSMGPQTAHRVKKLHGNRVETECSFVLHHERLFEVGGPDPALKPIPDCSTCFPPDQG